MRHSLQAEKLIDTLQHNAVNSGNRLLERRLADLTVWFFKNRQTMPKGNLGMRVDHLEKGLWISFEVMALLLERNHELEAMKRGTSMLWLPSGMTINDQEKAKEFG
jgi:hypothetical protein